MSAFFLLVAMAPAPILAFEPPPDAGSWIQHRAEALMTDRFRRSGFEVRASRSLTPPDPQAEVVLRVRTIPERIERGTTPMTLELAARGRWQRTERVKGPADNLERLAAALSDRLLSRLGQPRKTAEGTVETPLPFLVHRQLGRAAIRLDKGQVRQAMLAFDQAGRSARVGPLPTAVRGRRRAFQILVASGASRFEVRSELARASVERAQVAARKKDVASARRAWSSFLRYTDDYALRWRLPARLGSSARLISHRGDYVLRDGRTSWRIAARTGVASDAVPTAAGMIGALGKETLHLVDRVLSRRTERGRIRWRLRLPYAPSASGVLSTSGFIAVMGPKTVAWVDEGFGTLGQASRRTPPITASPGGVLVRLPGLKGTSTEEIGLLRPGKRTPAWRVALPAVQHARMTRDRIALVSEEGLHLLRTHNGRAARPVREWPKDARWLHAAGRYGTAVVGGMQLVVYDILAGRATGRFEGPGRPLAAITTTEGVAVLYRSGDLFHLDRDGRVLDRARPPGRPLQLVEGHPLAPGPVALTTEGIYAYSEMRSAAMRDVDGFLALAKTLADGGHARDALRIATAIASASAGRVAAAERLRAVLLADMGRPQAAARARQRAAIAADPTRPLSPLGRSKVR